jgi:hypothetical protein
MPRSQSAGAKRIRVDLDEENDEDIGIVRTTVASGARAGLLRSSHCLIPFLKKAAARRCLSSAAAAHIAARRTFNRGSSAPQPGWVNMGSA